MVEARTTAVRSGQGCLGGHEMSRADPGCSVRLPLAWTSTGVDCERGSGRSGCCPSRPSVRQVRRTPHGSWVKGSARLDRCRVAGVHVINLNRDIGDDRGGGVVGHEADLGTRPFGIGQGDDSAVVRHRPQSRYVAVETLGRLQRRTAEIRDDSANTHNGILPSRFDAAAAAGRIVPEADGRVACSLPALAFPDHDRDGKPVRAGDAVGWAVRSSRGSGRAGLLRGGWRRRAWRLRRRGSCGLCRGSGPRVWRFHRRGRRLPRVPGRRLRGG